MIAPSAYSLNLIRAIDRNEHDEAWKILSEAKLRNVDLSSPIGALRVTAIQFAAWRGWTDLLNALRELGADVNASDKLGRCPLHYAAHQGNADVTEWLVQRGATLDNRVEINSCTRDVYQPDADGTLNVVIGKNLPLPECWGRTALHQAVRNNYPEVVKILVKAGAQVDAQDERKVTPLLLAGSKVDPNDFEGLNKFAEIVDILVAGNASTNLVHPDTAIARFLRNYFLLTETVCPDPVAEGSSPLHHAAALGSSSATRRLLEGGARPLFQCSSTGSTALHIAAAAGSLDTLAVLLQAVDSGSIDIPDEVGRTALHRAAYQGYRECVELLANYGGNLAAETKTGVCVIDAIFAHVPRPLSFLTELLDAGVRPNGNCSTEKGSYVTVDFGVLAPKGHLQMGVVTALIGASSNIEQLGILKHPLVESFLSLKWSKLRGFFFVLVLVHVFFVLSLSGYAITLLRRIDDFTLPRHVLMLCSCLLLVHNTVQVLMVPRYYLRQFETWSSLTCAAVSLATSTVARDRIVETGSRIREETIATTTDGSTVAPDVEPPSWVFHSISLAILFAWIQMMLLVGRFPTYGYYALMFSTVLKNILKVLLAFICLIVGFALSFSVLFHENDQFRDCWRALVKTVVMMMGEYEYEDLFSDERTSSDSQHRRKNEFSYGDNENVLRVTGRIVFIGFVVLASIVLMNLMIGLAVNDIQGLEKEGHIRRLVKQAEFVAHLERVTSHRLFRSKWLHSRLRIVADSRRSISTRMTIGCGKKYPHQSNDVSSDLVEALFEIAAKNSRKNGGSGRKIVDEDLMDALISLEQLVRQLQNSQNRVCRLPANYSKSFVKRKVARRIRSTNI